MKRCTRCVMPETWDGITFDEEGVCSLCKEYEKEAAFDTEGRWKHCQIEGTYVDWDKVDCLFEPVRDWQKFIKRGFGRTTFQASKDIRDGLMDREEALHLVEKYDGKRPTTLDTFLEEVGMSEEEFMAITKNI